ncbi:hypothetical protein HOC13_03820 [Candidatus Woesearchaeota archaeon]|jgi:hypothetical protein|nr:hypothetical protein [Candidatus Woesearchaeota archaeon]MBT6774622.1 hypothetical protein [Candidatus Woesearchaeota archaeon]
MTLLKILKVENVEGDYSALEMGSGSSPEVYAYGIFSEIERESGPGTFARLRQESPLFSLLKDLGSYIQRTSSGEDIVAVVNKQDKDYISDKKVCFFNQEQTKLFSTYIDTLTWPQYEIMKKFNENLKQE